MMIDGMAFQIRLRGLWHVLMHPGYDCAARAVMTTVNQWAKDAAHTATTAIKCPCFWFPGGWIADDTFHLL